MRKKIIGMLAIGLVISLLLPMASANTIQEGNESNTIRPAKSPQLEITIRGGLGLHVYIKNIGPTDVHVSEMKLNLDGRVKYNTDSEALDIEAGKTKHVIYGVLGFGPTNIELTLDTITQTASGKILFGFVYGVE